MATITAAARAAVARLSGTVTHFANLANRNEELEAQLQQLRSSFNILQVFATPFAAVLICIIAIAAWRFT
uniref:Uncharacterized protein n=1 Tax=Oryza glumipatula TaxID=40148 RepID=A0A0E0A1F2_9ORYZ